ncbi:MAG: hypothetical protein LUQ65_03425, partial [Candidatus Helarchaeota archaeon]|nr:hypothetical protein [Candidatus Helarchaeota archaeon]
MKWDVHGVFDDIALLKEQLESDKSDIPASNTHDTRKLARWIGLLTEILNKMEHIESILIPKLEKAFQYQFESKELVTLSFFRPSIKNLFSELKLYFDQKPSQKYLSDFETWLNLADAAETLALIGDSALGLAAAQLFWDSKIARIGNITQLRADLVSNENLAKTCDRLSLYEYRIHNEPTVQDVKDETIQ